MRWFSELFLIALLFSMIGCANRRTPFSANFLAGLNQQPGIMIPVGGSPSGSVTSSLDNLLGGSGIDIVSTDSSPPLPTDATVDQRATFHQPFAGYGQVHFRYEVPPPQERWYCASHRVPNFLGGAHVVGPIDQGLHGLHMTVPTTHCTGITIGLIAYGLSRFGSWGFKRLQCNSQNRDFCVNGNFHLPLNQPVRSWDIDLKEFRPGSQVVLIYKWIENTTGTCAGPDKNSFGIAMFVTGGNDSAPDRGPDCPKFSGRGGRN